jgi:hypothetical protein
MVRNQDKGWRGEPVRHSLSARGIRTGNRRRKTTKGMRNLKMNPAVYKLRRNVMNMVYEAKELTPLPRLDIRITEDPPNAIMGRAGDQILWIPESYAQLNKNELRELVYHEILHAVFNSPHRERGIMTAKGLHKWNKNMSDRMFIEEIDRLKAERG